MKTLTAALSCPRCGGDLLHEGYEPVIASPDCGWVDARCDTCLDVYRFTLSATVVEPWPVDKLDRDARRQEGAVYASGVLEAMR